MKELTSYRVLANGVKMPKIGFGTWQIPNGEVAYNATLSAIKAGYIHIDTAHAYGNEESVGKAIKDSGIERDELFITTKLPSHIKDYEGTLKHFDESITSLGLEYIDLYLIHAPWPWSEIGKDCREGNVLAFKAMIELYNSGKVRAIGVSNFNKYDIENVITHTNFVPHVNQIEFHIGIDQSETLEYCASKNILVQAYSPLGTGKILNTPTIIEMAKKYDVTPAQLSIRYCLEKNTVPLPKTITPSRMVENSLVDFKIEDKDVKILDTVKLDIEID